MVDGELLGSPPTVLVYGPASGRLMRARYMGDAGDGRATVEIAGRRADLPVVPLGCVPGLEGGAE